jgi:hypothetical protein
LRIHFDINGESIRGGTANAEIGFPARIVPTCQGEGVCDDIDRMGVVIEGIVNPLKRSTFDGIGDDSTVAMRRLHRASWGTIDTKSNVCGVEPSVGPAFALI